MSAIPCGAPIFQRPLRSGLQQSKDPIQKGYDLAHKLLKPIPNDMTFKGFSKDDLIDFGTHTGIVCRSYCLVPAHAVKDRNFIQVRGKKYELRYNGLNQEPKEDCAIFRSPEEDNVTPFDSTGLVDFAENTQRYLLVYVDGDLKCLPFTGNLMDLPTAPGFSGGIVASQDVVDKQYFITGMHIGEGRFIPLDTIHCLTSLSHDDHCETDVDMQGHYLRCPGLFEEQELTIKNIRSEHSPSPNWIAKNGFEGLATPALRGVFGDHVLFGYRQCHKDASCTFKEALPGRHVARSEDQAKEIADKSLKNSSDNTKLTIMIIPEQDKNKKKGENILLNTFDQFKALQAYVTELSTLEDAKKALQKDLTTVLNQKTGNKKKRTAEIQIQVENNRSKMNDLEKYMKEKGITKTTKINNKLHEYKLLVKKIGIAPTDKDKIYCYTKGKKTPEILGDNKEFEITFTKATVDSEDSYMVTHFKEKVSESYT